MDDEIDVNKGMALRVVYRNGRTRTFLLGPIVSSKRSVKKVNSGEVLWGSFPQKKTRYLHGKRYRNVESAAFVDIKEPIGRGWWNYVNENECERFWIETDIDSSTYRFIFRIERDKNDIIVYGFFP